MTLEILTAARVVVMAAACVSGVLMALRAQRAQQAVGDTFTLWATGALDVLMAYTVVVQARQLGQPLKTWWGTPMLTVAVVLTLVALSKSKV